LERGDTLTAGICRVSRAALTSTYMNTGGGWIYSQRKIFGVIRKHPGSSGNKIGDRRY